eukprot:gene23981-29094_t
MAKTVKGRAAVQLIADATTRPGLFAFGELLDMPNIQAILPYDVLITQLDVSNVRELEDLLINDCMYTVHYAAGRDIRPGQLDSMLKVLNDWVKTSEELMQNVEQKVMWAGNMVEEHNERKKQIEAQIEETKKTIKPDPEFRGAQESIYIDADIPMEEDRSGGRSK